MAAQMWKFRETIADTNKLLQRQRDRLQSLVSLACKKGNSCSDRTFTVNTAPTVKKESATAAIRIGHSEAVAALAGLMPTPILGGYVL
eukprot:scaffold186925_cov18-Prasinocladus_malaysianus.AAC.1